jgi:hypothetical protein
VLERISHSVLVFAVVLAVLFGAPYLCAQVQSKVDFLNAFAYPTVQTLPDIRRFKSRNFRLRRLQKSKKEIEIVFFKHVPNFSLRELKHSEMKMVQEYCWAITQVAGRSRCGRLGSSVLEFKVQLDTFLYRHISMTQ